MKTNEVQQPQTPPGVIATLAAGFELTTGHIWIILLPFLVDLAYWLGPRIIVERLFVENLRPLLEEPSTQALATQLTDMASSVNILTSLSVPLIGVPGLMSGAVPEETPIPTQVYEPNSMFQILLIMACLSFVGLFLAAIYLNLISLVLKEGDQRPIGFSAFIVNVLKSVVRLFGLGIVLLIIMVMVWLPLLPVAFLAGLFAVELAAYVMIAGLVLVVIYLCMSVPGIVLNGRTLPQSLLESVRLVHGNAMQTTLLLLTIVLVSNGTNLLWHLADDGSWLTLVSIAGHAFISAALAVAFFLFYRDRWTLAQEQVVANPNSVR